MAFISRPGLPAAVVAAITLFAVFTTVIAAHESRGAGDLSYVVGWLEEPAYEGFPNAVSVRIAGPVETAVGALFEGGSLNPGDEFTYTFGHELEGSTVPYHNHISPDLGGTVTVTDSAPEGDVEIEVSSAGYLPADVEIRPDSSVTWRNVSDTVQAVHSGEGQVDDHDQDVNAPRGPVEGLEGSLQIEVTHVPTGTTRKLALLAAFRDPGHYVAGMIPTAPGAYTFRVFGEIDESPVDELFESGPGTFDDVRTQAEIQFPLQVSALREIEGAARGAQDAAAIAEDAANAAAADASSAQTLAIIAMAIGLGGVAVGAGGVAIGLRRK